MGDSQASVVSGTTGLRRVVQRGAWPAWLLVLLSLPLPYATGMSGHSAMLLGLLLASLAAVLALAEPPAERPVFLALFAWAYVARVAVLAALFWGVPAAGESLLGPDSRTYFRMSQFLARDHLALDAHPMVVFGSYDVAPYYLFASATYLVKADLFTLKLLNGGLTALVAPLMFSWCRGFFPRYAVLVGAIVAVHPSLIVLSTVDLLKDPSVLFFSVLAAWSLTRLVASRGVAALAGYSALTVAALVFLRTGRFYVVAYLELAVLVAVLLRWWRPQAGLPGSRRGAIAALLVFVCAEALPMTVGWPTSPILVLNNIAHVTGTPIMWSYGRGLLDSRAATWGTGEGLTGVTLDGAVSLANMIRRLYGPFVWVLPERWGLRELLAGDFLLYPGMLIWYSLLPFMGLGLATVGRRLIGGREADAVLTTLWIFLVIYLAQYLLINLSYRQREVMFPFLLVFALIGVATATASRRWRGLYAVYWGLVGSVAAAHTLIRTLQ